MTKKTEGRKSRDTVSLSHTTGHRYRKIPSFSAYEKRFVYSRRDFGLFSEIQVYSTKFHKKYSTKTITITS
jgi:hypothetical protein